MVEQKPSRCARPGKRPGDGDGVTLGMRGGSGNTPDGVWGVSWWLLPTRLDSLFPSAPIARAATVVRDSTDTYSLFFDPIDQRIGKAMQREKPSLTGSARSKAGVRCDKSRGSGELSQKCDRYGIAGLRGIEGHGLRKLCLSFGGEEIVHASLARRRATTSSPGSQVAFPEAIAASLRSIS